MISTPILAIGLPFLGGVGAPELIIILVIVLVLFGPKRLPQLGKSIGKTMKAFREGAQGKIDEDEQELNTDAASANEPAKAESKPKANSEA